MKTAGTRVIKFIEKYLVHSAGDYLGQPFVLRDWQKEIINELFELKPDGSYKHHTAYISLPKGNGKSILLGIPTVLDRFIQQALQQVLSPVFENEF